MNTPAPKTRIAEMEVVARSYELDSSSHVNHAVFLNYLEHARFDAMRSGGLSREAVAEQGWSVFVVRVEVDYLKEAHMDDRLLVRTQVVGYRRTSMIFQQEIVRPGDEGEDELVVRAQIHAVAVGSDGRPMRVPAEVKAALGPGKPWQRQPAR